MVEAAVHEMAEAQDAPQKLKQLRCDLFRKRVARIYLEGKRDEKITPFDKDFNQKMSEACISSIPVSKIIYDHRPDPDSAEQGYCFERSLLMFLCDENAVWVRGNNKVLELVHGKENSRHAWIEIGDAVYDPTTVLKYQKDLYYNMLKVTNTTKVTREEARQCCGIDTCYIKAVGNYISHLQGLHQETNQNCR